VLASWTKGSGRVASYTGKGYLIIRDRVADQRELLLQASSGAVSIHRLNRRESDRLDQWIVSRPASD
jgi:hypothetical protein